MLPSSTLCTPLLAEHKTLKKFLTEGKQCLAITKTLVCYQQYFYTESKTQNCISYWKELNSNPFGIRTPCYVRWYRNTLVGLLTVSLLKKYTIFEPLVTPKAIKIFTQFRHSPRHVPLQQDKG